MASIVLSNVARSFGTSLFSSIGGSIFSQLGRRLGKRVDQYLGLVETTDGARLENLRVQDSRYGVGLPLTFGQTRVAGNIIWASELIETKHEASVLGGKGGVMGSSASGTTYSYALHCAIAIAEGPIGGLLTIWGDSKIIYQNGVWSSGVVGGSTLYLGTNDQNADPLLESYIGNGKVPAYRGVAYIVLENFQLKPFGNRLPNITFEILPVGASVAPSWQGAANAEIYHYDIVARNKGMPPLVIEGSKTRARKMLVGGYTWEDEAAFSVVEYDVTSETPTETIRMQSASFPVSNIDDHSWALAPDKRFVALRLQDNASSVWQQFILYDKDLHVFGERYAVAFSTSENRQLAWLDAHHFVVSEAKDGKRGLHVFARAGNAIIDLGFFDVWGAETATTLKPWLYSQFFPMSGGLLYYVADGYDYFTSIAYRPVFWKNNKLEIGTISTLISGYTSGPGSGPHGCLLQTGDGEYTLFFATVTDMQMMSFRPSTGGVVITRPMQKITFDGAASVLTSHPVWFGNRLVVVHRLSTDSCYHLSEIALNDGAFEVIVDRVEVSNFASACIAFGAEPIDGTRLLLTGISGFYDDLSQVATIKRRNTGESLDHIVAALLARAGYKSADYDVSALNAITLDGYVLQDPTTAASAIEPLQIYELFDLVENDGCLKAVLHTNAPSVVLPLSETRAANEAQKEPLPSCERTRTQELDLPVEITIDYLDASRDYEIGTQRARRQATRGASHKAKITLPLVCTAAKAKQIAEARLFKLWAEREKGKISLSRRWLALDPADIVQIDGDFLRLTHLQLDKGVIEAQGVFVPATPVTSDAQADAGSPTTMSEKNAQNCQAYLMDLPLLRAQDDQPGVYATLSGLPGWKGGTLWRATDGVSFTAQADFSMAATAGIATTILNAGTPFYQDRANSVSIQLLQGTLSSCSEADLLGGMNVALLGDELIQFQTATLVGSGFYILSNLLRGRRGTEGTTTHALGERFVLLTAGTVQFLPALLTDRNRSYAFRALSNGQSLGDAWDDTFSYGLATLKPFAPTHLCGTRANGTSGDLSLSWKRRARKNADWVDYVDVPLDEPEELYDLEIMNGITVARLFENLTTPNATYTAAQQTEDWGSSIPSSFTINVYQRSARYGRGQKATSQI